VRYADVKNKEPLREAKVFVGMLPQDYNEESLKKLFSAYGQVTDVYVMRNLQGQTKGCCWSCNLYMWILYVFFFLCS
jgi:nucleolysin TIA-1/TIAR